MRVTCTGRRGDSVKSRKQLPENVQSRAALLKTRQDTLVSHAGMGRPEPPVGDAAPAQRRQPDVLDNQGQPVPVSPTLALDASQRVVQGKVCYGVMLFSNTHALAGRDPVRLSRQGGPTNTVADLPRLFHHARRLVWASPCDEPCLPPRRAALAPTRCLQTRRSDSAARASRLTWCSHPPRLAARWCCLTAKA